MVDVTDATFEAEVLARSESVPVVVDLWAPWCGPCRTLGPILEKVVGEARGAVALAKVNVDENPQVSASFQVQSIPAVYALADRKVVDGFIGALGEAEVRAFVSRLVPQQTEADALVDVGDEASLRKAIELEPTNERAIRALAEMLVDRGEVEEALELLARVPETPEVATIAARARLAASGISVGDGAEAVLDDLLERAREDDEARRRFLDVLQSMPADDPRVARYRKALASRLF
jgi:putative thioredoxin